VPNGLIYSVLHLPHCDQTFRGATPNARPKSKIAMKGCAERAPPEITRMGKSSHITKDAIADAIVPCHLILRALPFSQSRLTKNNERNETIFQALSLPLQVPRRTSVKAELRWPRACCRRPSTAKLQDDLGRFRRPPGLLGRSSFADRRSLFRRLCLDSHSIVRVGHGNFRGACFRPDVFSRRARDMRLMI
jgi:hypothetical protein